MITGILRIGAKTHRGGERPDLFILEFMQDGSMLFMNQNAIKGVSCEELIECLEETLQIIKCQDC